MIVVAVALWAVRLYPFAVGILAGAGSKLLSVTFIQSVLIAVLAGVIAAAGTIAGSYVAARISAKQVEPVHQDVVDVKAGLGLARRAEDPTSSAQLPAGHRRKDDPPPAPTARIHSVENDPS